MLRWVDWKRICREDELSKGQHILALKPKLNVKSYLSSSNSASCPHQIHFHHWHQFVWSPIRQNSRGEANRADDENFRLSANKRKPNHPHQPSWETLQFLFHKRCSSQRGIKSKTTNYPVCDCCYTLKCFWSFLLKFSWSQKAYFPLRSSCEKENEKLFISTLPVRDQ